MENINDYFKQTEKNHTIKYSGFLDPYEQQLLKEASTNYPDVSLGFYGGYEESERKVAIFQPDCLELDYVKAPISCLLLQLNTKNKMPKHGDFLGAILNLGIKRFTVGDIFIKDGNAYIMILNQVKDFVKTNLIKVANFKVYVKDFPLEELAPPKNEIDKITSTVSSLRLDSVCSSAFSLSRSKTSSAIKGENVKVNWEVITNPSYKMNEGDIISFKGRGRATLYSVLGLTRKNRIKITVHKVK